MNEIKVNVSVGELEIVDEKNPKTITYVRKVEPYLRKITQLKGKNYTDREIAMVLNISTSTFHKFKLTIPELQDAYNNGIEDLVDTVERAAVKEAVGYEYYEEAVVPKTGDVVAIKKYARGNVSAQKLILKNRRNHIYTDKKTIETHDLRSNNINSLENLTEGEIRLLLERLRIRKQAVLDVEVVDVD